MSILLPDKPQTRKGLSPLDARVFCVGLPKAGKSTLLAGWAPSTTLIIDTHRGTTLLDGEHYVLHVKDWTDFDMAVQTIIEGDHQFKTIGLDLVDDLYKFADQYVSRKKGVKAAALVDFGKGTAEAEAMFRETIGKLFSSKYGIWFVGHTDTEDNQGQTRYVPRLDKRVRTYVEGACSFIFLAETLGKGRVLHTQPSPRFQAGSRCPMPDTLPLDARKLYEAMSKGLGMTSTDPDGKDAV